MAAATKSAPKLAAPTYAYVVQPIVDAAQREHPEGAEQLEADAQDQQYRDQNVGRAHNSRSMKRT
jgi:hypothetical protein